MTEVRGQRSEVGGQRLARQGGVRNFVGVAVNGMSPASSKGYAGAGSFLIHSNGEIKSKSKIKIKRLIEQ